MLLLTHITIEIQQYNLKPAFVGKHLKAEIMVDYFHEQVLAAGKIGGQARAMVVHGEFLIKRRSACGKARDSVLARRIAADQRFAVEHGRVDRTEFSARTRCGRVLDCSG